jgi:hypothetical protein
LTTRVLAARQNTQKVISMKRPYTHTWLSRQADKLVGLVDESCGGRVTLRER